MSCWLFKSEPECYGIDHLARGLRRGRVFWRVVLRRRRNLVHSPFLQRIFHGLVERHELRRAPRSAPGCSSMPSCTGCGEE